MTGIFLHIVNMSITATVLAAVVLLLRLLLKKAPKWIRVLLWGLVALRLICPFAMESPFSLMPKTDWVEREPVTEENFFLNSVPDSIYSFDSPSFAEDITFYYYPIDTPEIELYKDDGVYSILSCVWAAGMVALLLYTVISTVRLRRSVGAALRVRDNIWESSAVDSPFVLGIIRPRIYVPRGMTEEKLAYVIAHEQAHIRRKDHLWKPLGFLLLTIHWFNPVMWLSYILLCRDIEMACDERVVKEYDGPQRADYSEALLECSVKRSMISACPLAFGEVGVKQRIKSVLNYKKPAFWIVMLAVVACTVTAVCFLTNPMTIPNPWVKEYVVGGEGILGQVDKEKYESVHEDFAIGADKYGRAVFKDPAKAFSAMKELYKEGLTLIRREKNLPPISQMTYKLYKKYGWQVTSGSAEAQTQASFISGFLDIYENSFDTGKPNTDLPAPTVEGDLGTDTVIASNVAEETLPYETLKQQQKEIWEYCKAVVSASVIIEYQEKIISAACNPGENYVTVFVHDFSEEDVQRFEKTFGHLSYILVSVEEPIETSPESPKQLTLDDVITLSAKGYDLTWEDFAEYSHTDIGSGLYIWHLPIDDLFSVKVGGGSIMTAPMYIYLCAGSGEQETRIDIRDGGVRSFIEVQKSLGDALLFGNPLRYYVELAWEEAKQIAESKNVEIDKNRFLIGHVGNDAAIWVDFYIKTDGAWSRETIRITIMPSVDGTYRVVNDPLIVIPDTPAETSGEFEYRPIPGEET